MTTSLPPSHLAYRALVRLGLPRVMRSLGGDAVVFCFHNVVPESHVGRGDASLHMSVGHFEELVGWISTTYEVISLSEIATRAEGGRTVRGLAALTFDDAYVGTVRHGLPLLDRLGLPASLFVVSSQAEQPRAFWWDRLSEAGKLSAQSRRECLTRHRGKASVILSSTEGTHAVPELPDDLMPESWEGLRRALRSQPLLEIGSHTATHPNLAMLSMDEMADELRRSRAEIREALQVDADTVSYPYGLHDSNVLGAAREAGYMAGVTLGPGSVRSAGDPLGIPRLNVPAGIGLDAMECWASGLKPSGRS